MLLALFSSVALADPLVAVVIVGQEAREEGYALELDDLVLDDALPIDVAEGEQVLLIDPQGERHPLDVAPGEAWEITGKGETWMAKLGEEVRTDVLEVRGTPEAVRALADSLDAEVRIEGDHVWLVRADILFDAPWAEPLGDDAVDEVRFVQVEAASRVQDAAPSRPVMRALPPTRAGVATSVAAPVATVTQEGPAPASIADIFAAVEATAPEAQETVVTEVGTRVELDPFAYIGLYLCGDGTMLLLSGEGSFSHPRAVGTWKVSAPGVVRLEVGGKVWGRAGIDVQTRHCRAVG